MHGKNTLAKIAVSRKTGSEPFTSAGQPLACNLLDFWQWYASDLVGNSLRGTLAEYIVATALGVSDTVRVEWDAYDIKTKSGLKVEVKSGAYVQSWEQKKYSAIQFGISPTYGWEAESNSFDGLFRRQADVYVFCVLKHLDQSTINPLDMDQWDFYVLATSKLNEELPKQKTLTLNALVRLNPVAADYSHLAEVIDMVGKSRWANRIG